MATVAEVLGTKTKKDTVNAALREVGQRLERLRALARLGEMADQGDWLGYQPSSQYPLRTHQSPIRLPPDRWDGP